ncbi:hypothetical protein CDV31_002681 [Fusarium ambrosium]|uniref:Catalase core domain-containing protein n=1 Tax=Fusarium ambrosium TaxID=131363 RepID=A0A428UW76_9HYPO|nr:hypothetical protein CDV31_002681 [Fusarium ambrosium]
MPRFKSELKAGFRLSAVSGFGTPVSGSRLAVVGRQLTHNSGDSGVPTCPQSSNATSVQLRNGPGGGLVLLQDTQLIETLAHFARERIPERVVHAKAAGFLSAVGKKTKCLLRISTVGPERGSADTVRDVHGWAMKLYTDDGNLDLVFNNMPVFFIRDPVKFPSLNRSHKRHPKTNMPDADMFWDFHVGNPEGIHELMHLFSDRGTPASLRTMNAYSGHTYKFTKDPRNYFADIEQAAFSPSTMVPGWAPSADPVLQARMFSYPDAPDTDSEQTTKCSQPMQQSLHSMLKPTTFRTTAAGGTVSPTFTNHEKWVAEVSNFTTTVGSEDFEQATGLWKVLGREKGHQERFIDNVADNVVNVKNDKLRSMVYDLFSRVDPDLGACIRKAVELVMQA